MPWTGQLPGTPECEQYGLFVVATAGGWQPCAPGTPGCMPDYNILYGLGKWDRKNKRWRL
jgi:hypothetical protein